MRLVSANVNGIRAAARRGGLDALAAADADVVALQEVRATGAQLAEQLRGTPFEDWAVTHAEAATLGRAGVALLTRTPPTRRAFTLDVPAQVLPPAHREPFAAFADSGRWVEIDLAAADGDPVTVVSAYMPKGGPDGPLLAGKLAFLEAVSAWFDRAPSDRFVVVGDVNVAHTEHDLKNAKGNVRKPGFLPVERAYLDRWFAGGVVDVARALAGPGPGPHCPYTWWSWRGKAFDNDAGWRIDYHLAGPGLAPRATYFTVGRASAYDLRWSDHAAIAVDYDVAIG
ncbi:exodeoxyribonuclease III [Agilicoccus flavus]|uniref:exodeoxyribonuclease III n=1 Tax=Agilicoccus flavus TaxID=2775968 RepID=UPI001CF634C6|nr:exodeoxyribonuclease III [Agilicoccus flavus]